MADEQKNIKLNIDPNIVDSSKMKELINDLKTIDKLSDRIYQKGKNNNFTISAKDNANLRGTAGNIQQNANGVNKQLNDAMSMYDSIKSGKAQGSSQDLAKLEQMSYKLMSALYKAQSKGYNPTNGTIHPNNQHFNEALNFRVNTRNRNFNTPHGQDAEMFNDFNSKMKTTLRDLGSKVSNTRYNSNKISDRVGDTIRNGSVSAERLQQYRSSLSMGPERIKDLNSDISKYRTLYSNQKENLSNQVNDINKKEKAGNFSPQEAQSENARKIALQAQIESINKSIQRLNQFTDTLNNANTTFKKTNTNLEGAVNGSASASGQGLNVGAAKDSFMGMLNSRKSSLAIGATGVATGFITGAYKSGASVRQNAEQYVDPIMLDQANRNGVSSRADNKILNSLSKLGIKNGTSYNGNQMAQFASAYTTSTGKTNDYARAANVYSQLSRYTGMGTNNTLGLEAAAGNAGVMGTSFARAVGGEITNSGMTAKSGEQAQSLTALLNSESKYGVSTRNANDLSAVQGTMAKYGTTLQGSNFTNSYSALSGEATDFNDPVSRMMFASGNPKYAGVGGQAKELEAMEDAKTDPTKLKPYIKNVLASNGNNKEQAAMLLDLRSNGKMSMKQAKAWISAYRKGDLNNKQLAKRVQRNINKGEGNGKDSYDSSGTQTLDEKQTIKSQAEQKTSESGDTYRRFSNWVTHDAPGTLLTFGAGIGMGALGVGKSALGLGIGSRVRKMGGRILGSTKLGQKVMNSTPAKWMRNLFGGGASTAEEGAESAAGKSGGLFSRLGQFGKNAYSSVRESGVGGTIRNLFTKGRGAVGKAASSIRESGITGGLRNLFSKGKGALSSLGKGGAKGGLEDLAEDGLKDVSKLGKANAITGTIFTGLDLAHTFSTTKKGSKKRKKGVGEDIGSGLLGTAGGIAGGIFGGAPGALAGNFAGNYVGGKIGKFIGGMFGGGKSKKSDKSSSKAESSKSGTKRTKLNKEQKSILKGFNDMLDKAEKVIAEAKGINGGGSSKNSGSSSNVTGTGGKGTAALKSIANKVGKDMGVDPSIIYAQLALESNDATSALSKNNNFGGIVYTGAKGETKGSKQPDGNGYYANFDNTDDFASVYESTLKNMGVTKGMSLQNYTKLLGSKNYYTDNYSHYLSMMEAKQKQYGKANGGIFNYRTFANGGIFNSPTAFGSNIVGEAGTEAAIPMNASHKGAGESMLNQVSRAMGKVVVSPTELSAMRKSSSANVNLSPNYNINVNGGSNSSSDEIAQAVKQAIKPTTQDMMKQLNNYFSNLN